MSEKILIVGDEREIADLIELYLNNEGYMVYKFRAIEDVLQNVPSINFKLIILDIVLIEFDGFELLDDIRERFNYPLIMLTTEEGEKHNKKDCLGVDDYITKPFCPLKMIAQVKALLSRYNEHALVRDTQETDDVLYHLDLTMNIKAHQCFLKDEEIYLTPTEFSILQVLLKRKGEAVSAEEIFHEIWKDECYTKMDNALSVHIRHLREKLNDTFEKPMYIKTIWGVGYKIEK